jgi:hypothetical protein
MEKRSAADRAHDIAVGIYVELVARNTEITSESVKLTASASNIAALSLKLADAFVKAEEEAILAVAPKKATGVQGDDLAKWMK